MEKNKNFNFFWEILENNLKERYNSKPVHSLGEIDLLAKRFPNNIKLLTFKNIKNNTIEAGIVLFINRNVVKSQYIASSPEGRKNRVSDALYHSIVNTLKDKYQFIDFGTCEEENNTINNSLLNIKEKFGCNTYPIYTHSVSTSLNFTL